MTDLKKKLTNNTTIKSPYPYFGGKSKIAGDVWQRFGQCDRYIEPFFGSGAILLANPFWNETKEIVNDLDHYIANTWRAIRKDPEQVAYWCDAPTIEVEMHLQHIWLVNEGANRIKAVEYDPDHYDAEVAGKWLLGMANWIGSQFAVGKGPWTYERLKTASELGTYNIHEIKKHAKQEEGEKGVGRARPHLSNKGQGINRQLPHLRNNGKGVNRKLGGDSAQQREFVDTFFPKKEGLYAYIRQLAERFVEVDVCCGDWARIVKPAVTLAGKTSTGRNTAAVFLDPPYSAEAGRSTVYTNEDFSVAHAVREWCISETDNQNLKIALAGYDIEHEILEKAYGWTAFQWSANGGYSSFGDKGNASHANKKREIIWFSPSCK